MHTHFFVRCLFWDACSKSWGSKGDPAEDQGAKEASGPTAVTWSGNEQAGLKELKIKNVKFLC
jgi:hypothetical protein